MSPEAERDPRATGAEGDPYVRDQLAAFDVDLMRHMPADARLDSGVPDGQRAGALDFIQMTGLTRPPVRHTPRGRGAGYVDDLVRPDLDVSAPLSFYEKGVADVDESMDGGFDLGLRDASLDADLVPVQGAELRGPSESRSAKAFRDIIADLEAGTTGKAGAGLDSPGSAPEADVAESAFRALVDELASGEVHDSQDVADGAPALEVAVPEEPILPSPPPPEPEVQRELEVEPDTEVLSAPDFETDLDATSRHEFAQEPEPVPDEAPMPVVQDAGATPAATPDAMDDFDDMLAALSESAPAPTPPKADAGANAEDLSEDWDALLDSVTGDAEPERGDAPVSAPSGALAQAEQLMQVLSSPHGQPVTPALSAPPGGGAPEPGTEAALTYDYNAVPSRRRSRRHSRLARRGWRLLKVAFLFCIFAGAGVYFWWYVLGPMIERPEDLAASAAHHMDAHRYAEASTAYLQLARRPSADRADAQFRAAYALTLDQPDVSIDETRGRFTRALEIFETFVAENPQHPKHTRALSIMGRLQYELANYDAAIALLRDRVKPENDPAAALARLRYLARAYAKTGAYDEAETAYLQAATLPGNYGAETDYLELGDLFRTRAGLLEDPAAREVLEETAVAYWKRGSQVPGINPTVSSTLQERLEWSEFTEEQAVTTDIPVMPESAPAITEPAPVAVPAPDTAPESPLPAPENTADRVEDPAVEMEAMLPEVPAESGATAPADAPPAAPVTE